MEEAALMPNHPPVSCVMPTDGRRRFVPRAVEYFLRQHYPNKVLLVVADGVESVADFDTG